MRGLGSGCWLQAQMTHFARVLPHHRCHPTRDVFNERPVGTEAAAALEGPGAAGAAGPAARECLLCSLLACLAPSMSARRALLCAARGSGRLLPPCTAPSPTHA